MTDEMTDADKVAMSELRAEMVKKAKKAGVKVTAKMTAEDIEQAIADASLEVAPEADPEKEEMASEIAALKGINAALEAQVEGLLDEVRALTDAPEQDIASEPTVAEVPQGGSVTCTVTKKGADQISNGEGGFFKWKDSVNLPAETAHALEDRAMVEIDE